MSEKCNDCGFHFDHLSNSLYKHKYDKACEKNINRKEELQREYEANPLRKSLPEIMANIDLNAFKERVSVDGDKPTTASPTKNDLTNPYRSSPSLGKHFWVHFLRVHFLSNNLRVFIFGLGLKSKISKWI